MDRNDPLRNYRFTIEFEGSKKAGFSDVIVAETTVDMVDYRNGSDPTHARKLSGLTKYGNITLKRGMTTGKDGQVLHDWHKAVLAKGAANNRKDVTLSVLDEAGQEVARFVIAQAWPAKHHQSDLSGKGAEVIQELLELANEGYERVK